jgi:predicted transcriptional regulator
LSDVVLPGEISPALPPIEALARQNLRRLASTIVAAYLQGNKVPISDLTVLIAAAFDALVDTVASSTRSNELTPTIRVSESLMLEHIVCLEDGARLKMLKRHLRTKFGLTPEQYRTKWGLPGDYPMTAPAYAARRSEMAKSIAFGVGSKGRPRRA